MGILWKRETRADEGSCGKEAGWIFKSFSTGSIYVPSPL